MEKHSAWTENKSRLFSDIQQKHVQEDCLDYVKEIVKHKRARSTRATLFGLHAFELEKHYTPNENNGYSYDCHMHLNFVEKA